MSRLHVDLPTVMDLVRQNAARSPDAPAFADAAQRVTWGEFDRRTERAANAYLDYAVQGDRVAFLTESSVDQTVMLVGAMKAGCIVTNVHLKASTETLRYCIDETAPKVLVVDESFADRVAADLWDAVTESVATVVTIGEATREYEQSMDEFVEGQPTTRPDVLREEDDILTIWWTSGSTGRPKGWCHTNRGIYVKAMKGSARYGIDRFGKTLCALSPSFGAWYNTILQPIWGAESVYFMPDWDPDQWLDVVETEGITHAGMVASMWREVLDRGIEQRDMSTLTSIYSTGEKLDEATLEGLREHVSENVHQSYGSTEMYGTVLYNEEMEGDRIESIGKAQTGTEVRIVEEGGSPEDELPAGEVGEIVVRGPDLPAWAWRNSAKTREAFEDGWWLSGDLGYKDEDGYLYFEGRADFQIKSRGVKIMPAPIEKALKNHPSVDQAVVVGVAHDDYGQMVSAIVVASDPDLTADDLEEWCLDSDLVADFQRPREYHFVDEIEKTSSGKLDRRETMEELGLESA